MKNYFRNKPNVLISKIRRCNFYINFLLISIVGILSGCNVSDKEIEGDWQEIIEDHVLGNRLVVINFENNHTGSFTAYSERPNYIGGLNSCCAVGSFTWKIDGYMVFLDGCYAEDENTTVKNFSTEFRYTNESLVHEGISFPGLYSDSGKLILHSKKH